jgi:amino acid permease
LDLVLQLSLEQGVKSYEDLGFQGFGRLGQLMVLSSKLLYSFGCLVAYIIVVKDNLGPALLSLVFGKHTSASPVFHFLQQSEWVTWIVSFVVILPLCLLRDMTPLASVSLVSVLAMVLIVGIVIYLFLLNPNEEIREKGTTMYEDWLEIRWAGYLECLGTFVFTFVSVRES